LRVPVTTAISFLATPAWMAINALHGFSTKVEMSANRYVRLQRVPHTETGE
jgi:hypothetical protein